MRKWRSVSEACQLPNLIYKLITSTSTLYGATQHVAHTRHFRLSEGLRITLITSEKWCNSKRFCDAARKFTAQLEKHETVENNSAGQQPSWERKTTRLLIPSNIRARSIAHTLFCAYSTWGWYSCAGRWPSQRMDEISILDHIQIYRDITRNAMVGGGLWTCPWNSVLYRPSHLIGVLGGWG